MAYNPKAQYAIHTGKMENVLPALEGKFHAVLCDPPYGISFMGKEWDIAQGPAEFQARVNAWGNAILPLLYPGALVFMFGGTRMWHRLAAGMEDAGFEMWDTLMWLHGQGFPKGMDISKLIDKNNGDVREVISYDATRSRPNREVTNYEGGNHKDNGATITAAASSESEPWSGRKTPSLKPSWEPVLCFRAPAQGRTYAELAQMFGSGALNIDGGRIGYTSAADAANNQTRPNRESKDEDSKDFPSRRTWNEWEGGKGRYPANLALDEVSAALLDEQSGCSTSPIAVTRGGNRAMDFGMGRQNNVPCFGDSGGASRFFYCAKASSSERNGGLENNNHPTVKPIDLCTWLATLLLPPSSVGQRRILVPFSGSGSEMIGCLGAGWDEVVGVELDAYYCNIARARIKYHNGLLSADGVRPPAPAKEAAQPGLFS